jgi:serine O-acetyltransferase
LTAGRLILLSKKKKVMIDQGFVEALYKRQSCYEAVPGNDKIAEWAEELIGLLFPEKGGNIFPDPQAILEKLQASQATLTELMTKTKACSNCDIPRISSDFFKGLPEIYSLLNSDVEAIEEGDPAARSSFEVIRAYPGFFAICFYRIAHLLHQLGMPLIPRILTEYAHSKTGIDIHPGAIIGGYFCVDHGTGLVIGETTQIGKHVKLYQGVTLGALSVEKSFANTKRHPTVEDHVVIYSGATILGGETVIGSRSIIGGNVWLTRSVPPGSKVYYKSAAQVIPPQLRKENLELER